MSLKLFSPVKRFLIPLIVLTPPGRGHHNYMMALLAATFVLICKIFEKISTPRIFTLDTSLERKDIPLYSSENENPKSNLSKEL